MEERTITISLEKAREYYNKGGELRKIALQAYRKDEMCECIMPKTWKEYRNHIFLDDKKKYEEVRCSLKAAKNGYMPDTFQAYLRIRYLYEYYLQEWVPNWDDAKQTKYCIVENDGLEVERYWQGRQHLAFQTQELAEQFLDNFRDLIIKANIL